MFVTGTRHQIKAFFFERINLSKISPKIRLMHKCLQLIKLLNDKLKS